VLLVVGASAWGQTQTKERILLPGDLLEIFCGGDARLNVQRVVAADGTIELPDLGEVGVATLRPSEIASKINEAYLDLGKKGFATVCVHPMFIPGQPIEFDGAIAHRLSLRFLHRPTLESLLKICGPTDQADCSKIEISHADGSFESANSEHPFWLQDGDRVTIPVSSGSNSVEVVGGVVKPIHLDLRGLFTVQEALDEAGGVATRGNPNHITILRRNERIPIHLPDDDGFPLLAGDQLCVEAREVLNHVLVEGAVKTPGLVDFRPGLTLLAAIDAAGGVDEFNRSDSVLFKQMLNGAPRTIKLSLRFLRSQRIPDPVLGIDDVIQIGPLKKVNRS
jgi:protein involved in polysaccharide export with SLBB domain